MTKQFYTHKHYLDNIQSKPERNSFRDLTGLTFGKITVLDFAGYESGGDDKGSYPYWWCKCSCGNPKYFKVITGSLIKRLTKSCGCLYKNSGGERYWAINNKHYLKSDVCKVVGLKQQVVVKRMRKGIPLKYAIIPDRFSRCQYKDKIFNLNGDLFWWNDLKVLFGEDRPMGSILHTYTTVENWLIQDDLLSDNDYFEEIDL